MKQGEISSSDLYKLYNNEQAQAAQDSALGVKLDHLNHNIVSCISLADDAVLLSSNIIDLQNLLHLTEIYCDKYGVDLVIEKTQFLIFGNKNVDRDSHDSVQINGIRIPVRDEAEHLGILRASDVNNTSSIMHRISAYRKQMFSLLPAGLASHHRGNPATSLKVEKLYCLPVLLSGLIPLALNRNDLRIVSNYRKKTLSRLMRLPDATPEPVVYFLAGSLPTTAYIHLRQLSLFAMVCHQENNILMRHARSVLLTCNSRSKSWFFYLRDVCIMYGLPHPLDLLSEPPSKEIFKKLCRLKVYDYWHKWLCSTTSSLNSLSYLRAPFLGLDVPHPIWATLDTNPYQAKAAVVQALFLSGRYRTEKLRRHWALETGADFAVNFVVKI